MKKLVNHVAQPTWNTEERSTESSSEAAEEEVKLLDPQIVSKRQEASGVDSIANHALTRGIVLDLCQDAVSDEEAVGSWMEQMKHLDAMLAEMAKEQIDQAIEKAGARDILI